MLLDSRLGQFQQPQRQDLRIEEDGGRVRPSLRPSSAPSAPPPPEYWCVAESAPHRTHVSHPFLSALRPGAVAERPGGGRCSCPRDPFLLISLIHRFRYGQEGRGFSPSLPPSLMHPPLYFFPSKVGIIGSNVRSVYKCEHWASADRFQPSTQPAQWRSPSPADGAPQSEVRLRNRGPHPVHAVHPTPSAPGVQPTAPMLAANFLTPSAKHVLLARIALDIFC